MSNSLVALQFQDRVSQILAHTASCIGGLREDFGGQGGEADAGVRERLKRYARRPEGMATLEVAPRGGGASDVTFF